MVSSSPKRIRASRGLWDLNSPHSRTAGCRMQSDSRKISVYIREGKLPNPLKYPVYHAFSTSTLKGHVTSQGARHFLAKIFFQHAKFTAIYSSLQPKFGSIFGTPCILPPGHGNGQYLLPTNGVLAPRPGTPPRAPTAPNGAKSVK